MELKSLVLIVALVLVEAAADDHALDGCLSHCGGVPIIYPFGVGSSSKTGKKCFLEEPFEVTCHASTLYSDNIPVIAINLTSGQVDMMVAIFYVCYDSYGSVESSNGPVSPVMSVSAFTISSKDNKFVNVGCDNRGYLDGFYDGVEYSTGCFTRCHRNSMKIIIDGRCSGVGCCQVDLPHGMRNTSVQTYAFENFHRSLSFNNCSYSFVVKNGNYTFSKKHLENLPYNNVPVVFDWTVGSETCKSSKRGTNSCKGNSSCLDSDTGYGYRCRCREGYEGNPYHPNGCIDIDECKTGKHRCISDHNCLNTVGSYTCFCPKGQSGTGTKDGYCHQNNTLTKVVTG